MGESKCIFKIEGFDQLTYASIEKILYKYNQAIEETEVNKVFKKKLFSIVVECLENIQKHAYYIGEFKLGPHSYSFNISANQVEYTITAMNIVSNSSISSLKRKLTLISQLNPSHLKELYKRTLKKTPISDKGGADLGLIDIAIKSNNKVSFSFSPINKELSLYKIQIRLNLQ
jgi:hypothetical protein